MKNYLKLMRVKHYIKNLIIFIPLVFSKNLFNVKFFWVSLCGFLIFCLTSSVIYIINDINDVEKDRQHPTKCKRPIASGAISKRQAVIVAVILIIIVALGQGLLMYREGISLVSGILLICYLLLNLFYSRGGKNVAILDVVILSAGYMIRVFYGACMIEVEVSLWLYLTVLTGSLYLGLGKRRNEIVQSTSGNTRAVLRFYNYDFLDKCMYMCISLAINFYALWSMQTDYRAMIWTVPLVIIMIMKYSLQIENKELEGNPVDIIVHDKTMCGFSVFYAVAVISIIYFGGT